MRLRCLFVCVIGLLLGVSFSLFCVGLGFNLFLRGVDLCLVCLFPGIDTRFFGLVFRVGALASRVRRTIDGLPFLIQVFLGRFLILFDRFFLIIAATNQGGSGAQCNEHIFHP